MTTERKKLTNKLWRAKNREKVKEYKKQYYHRTKNIQSVNLRNCIVCNKEFKPKSKWHPSQRYCSPKCNGKAWFKNNKSWAIQSNKERTREWESNNKFKKRIEKYTFDHQKELIRQRDHYSCVKCGTSEDKLHTHHKTYQFPPRIENCITVCVSCHNYLNRGEEPPIFLMNEVNYHE